MAIAKDASTPAAVTGSTAWSTAKTTAAFSPPANVLLVALVVGDGNSTGTSTAAITDSLGGTWTLLKRENTANPTAPSIGGTVEIWCKWQAAAQTGMTVTLTGSGATSNGFLFHVLVLTGANSTQAGVVAGNFHNSATGAAMSQAITPGAAGNYLVGVAMNYTSATAATVLSGTTNDATLADSTNGDWYASFVGTSTTTTSSTTYGYSTSLTEWHIAVAEIQAASGGATTFPVSGSTAGVSGTTASVTLSAAVTGNAAGVSATTATVGLSPAAVTGTVPGTSGTTASVTMTAPVTGSTPATSSTSASVTAAFPVSGTTAGTSTTTGSVGAILPVAGTVTGISSTALSVGALLPVSGPVNGVSGTSGSVGGTFPISGKADATTATTGTVTARFPVTGSVAAVSGTSGSVSLLTAGQFPVSGTTAAVTSTTATVGGVLPVAARTDATSGTSLSVGLHANVTGGVVVASSGTAGNVQLFATVTGTVTAITTTTGRVGVAYPVAGAAAGLSGTYGSVALTGSLRDLTLRADPLTTRWSVAPAADRWQSSPLPSRFTAVPSPDRFAVSSSPPRWAIDQEET